MGRVRFLALNDWRKWVAALCVGLLSFAIIEQASAHHLATTVSYNVASAEVASAVSGREERPDEPAAPAGQQHHCCGAHVSGLPFIDGEASVQPALRLAAPRFNEAGPRGDPAGLDRPPKPSARI